MRASSPSGRRSAVGVAGGRRLPDTSTPGARAGCETRLEERAPEATLGAVAATEEAAISPSLASLASAAVSGDAPGTTLALAAQEGAVTSATCAPETRAAVGPAAERESLPPPPSSPSPLSVPRALSVALPPSVEAPPSDPPPPLVPPLRLITSPPSTPSAPPISPSSPSSPSTACTSPGTTAVGKREEPIRMMSSGPSTKTGGLATKPQRR